MVVQSESNMVTQKRKNLKLCFGGSLISISNPGKKPPENLTVLKEREAMWHYLPMPLG